MSALTRKDRRHNVVAVLGIYGVPIPQSEGIIDQAVDFSRDEEFWNIFPDYPNLFLVTDGSFNDGAAWPTGFFAYAKRAYTVSGGVNTPMRFATIRELPQLIKNDRIKGITAQPVFYMVNRTFKSLPAGLTAMKIEYYKFPTYTASDDTGTDTMPLWSEPAITRGAAERIIRAALDEDKAFQLSIQERERAEIALQRLVEEKFKLETDSILD